VTELVDCGLDGNVLAAIRCTAAAVEGVLMVRDMRGRRMGPFIAVELCLDVDPWISISVAHHVRCQVAAAVRRNHDEVRHPSLSSLLPLAARRPCSALLSQSSSSRVWMRESRWWMCL
jgi:divalent metal cation (Fe/Co/Zn/Cd) transporter